MPKQQTEADKIWDEIKDLPISMFTLPGQKVSDHLEKLEVPGNELYVRLVSSAVMGSLEEAIGDKYAVEQAEKYTIIKRANKVVIDEPGPQQYVRRRAR